MKIKSLLFGVLVLLCLGVPAQAQIFIEEGKVRLEASPGENIAGQLVLHNTSDKNVNVKVYGEDFAYKPPYDGSKDFFPEGSTPDSSAPWVHASSPTLMFGPYAQRTLSYTVNVPDDFDRGHYSVLFFESMESQVEAKTGLNVVTRVGCLFFIEPRHKVKKTELSDLQFTAGQLTAQFANLGNVTLIPDGTFYIIDRAGTVFDRGTISKIYLPAGKSSPYTVPFNRDLAPGAYTLVLTVALEDDDVLVKEIDFQKSAPSSFQMLDIRD